MIVCAARLRIVPALLLAPCIGSESDHPVAVRLATLFPDLEAVGVKRLRPYRRATYVKIEEGHT